MGCTFRTSWQPRPGALCARTRACIERTVTTACAISIWSVYVHAMPSEHVMLYVGREIYTPSRHHHLLEVIVRTATVLELRQKLLYTTHSVWWWWWCIEPVFQLWYEEGMLRFGPCNIRGVGYYGMDDSILLSRSWCAWEFAGMDIRIIAVIFVRGIHFGIWRAHLGYIVLLMIYSKHVVYLILYS